MAIFGKSSQGPAPAGRGEPARGPSVIGPHIRVQGELLGDEDVLVEGRVEGKVLLAREFRVATGAIVVADVHAATVVIAGQVTGDVSATERVEILPSGSLEGNIRAPKVAVGEGARFKGSVDMSAGSPPGDGAPR
ncbi:MAG TPA: polymer-forming cytoskeletal protein [Thermoanaerobaculia bacterium]|nr:polymer-forming cytoskeletal protein [Thermoanaerobaculia bacterium]